MTDTKRHCIVISPDGDLIGPFDKNARLRLGPPIAGRT